MAKMKADKMIPIPLMLYKIMTQYIEKNKIQPRDYIFKEKNGAYRCESFVKRFRNHCKKNQIAGGDYIFKSHDYRHTLATRFYDDGVSMQVIRDYLGHVSENMTKQYVDYRIYEREVWKNTIYLCKARQSGKTICLWYPSQQSG